MTTTPESTSSDMRSAPVGDTASREPPRSSGRWFKWFLPVLLVAGGTGYGYWWWRDNARKAWLDQTTLELRLAEREHRTEDVLRLAKAIVATDPGAVDAALLGAAAAEDLNRYDDALELLDIATDRSPTRRPEAHVAKSVVLLALHRSGAAEAELRRTLELDADNIPALQTLCYILFVEGRRWESRPYRFRLLRLSAFQLEDLTLLGDARVLGNMTDLLDQWRAAEPENAMPLLGLARLALRHGRPEEAETYLSEVIERQPDCLDAHAELGQILLRRLHDRRDAALRAWYQRLPDHADEHPGIWVVKGLWAQQRRNWSGAVRCFWEAVLRDPNHTSALYQLGVSLVASGDPDRARAFQERSLLLQELATICFDLHESGPNFKEMARAAELCEKLGRFWESAAWCHEILQIKPPSETPGQPRINRAAVAELERAQKRCRDVLVRVTPRIRRDPPPVHADYDLGHRIDLADFDPPRFAPLPPDAAPGPAADLARQPRFREVTREVGIDFSYFNGDDPSTEGRRMFEFTGGGVAVIDYDQDGWPDLYFTQGCDWPVDPQATTYRDRLYRNMGGRRFVDVTDVAGLGDNGFSQGAAVGDLNNDGWPDLVVGNVGANRVYLNNGDGTFTDAGRSMGVEGDEWTTSCAIADVNGDSVPDLYCVNYLQKGRAFELICGRQGRLRACSPTEFEAAQDRLYLGTGTGTLVDATRTAGIEHPDGKGLGCLIADFNRDGRVELFVANDTTANFLFVNRHESGRTPQFDERAMLAGVGVDRDGSAQACMGITLDDVDGDGRFDFFVTNFHKEWNTLYRQQDHPQLLFLDESDGWGAVESSLDTLGFGTQFIDAELDGLPDLVITNGHVDDFRYLGTPYRMAPQYLRNLGGRFADWPARDLGAFFRKRFLGRGLARLDFNADGREDFAVSHLDAPVALVANESKNAGHYIAVVLVGRQVARDAVGADVTVESGSLRHVRQVTAGDGYLASNEHRLVFGLGDRQQIDRITVRWPDGSTESYHALPADRDYRIVQGVGPFALPHRTP